MKLYERSRGWKPETGRIKGKRVKLISWFLRLTLSFLCLPNSQLVTTGMKTSSYHLGILSFESPSERHTLKVKTPASNFFFYINQNSCLNWPAQNMKQLNYCSISICHMCPLCNIKTCIIKYVKRKQTSTVNHPRWSLPTVYHSFTYNIFSQNDQLQAALGYFSTNCLALFLSLFLSHSEVL